MSELKLKITDKAKEDIVLIVNYIAKDNKIAAKSISKYFYKICLFLTDYPYLGITRPDFTYKDICFYVAKKHYIIAYKIGKNNLFVLRVLSGYQDICKLL